MPCYQMPFLPRIKLELTHSGDIIVMIRQKYNAGGRKPAYRWRIAGIFEIIPPKKKRKK